MRSTPAMIQKIRPAALASVPATPRAGVARSTEACSQLRMPKIRLEMDRRPPTTTAINPAPKARLIGMPAGPPRKRATLKTRATTGGRMACSLMASVASPHWTEGGVPARGRRSSARSNGWSSSRRAGDGREHRGTRLRSWRRPFLLMWPTRIRRLTCTKAASRVA